LGTGFTEEEIEEVIMGAMHHKGTSTDGIPEDVWKMFCAIKGKNMFFFEFFCFPLPVSFHRRSPN
jgi:hypothetical protein